LERTDTESIVTAEQLGVRDLPKGWVRASLDQVLASAQQIVRQSQAGGGSGDPRLAAALKVLELKEKSEAKKKAEAAKKK
jgi:hypothetical protein